MRTAAGSYILNSGLIKLESPDIVAKDVHGTASRAYPFLEDVDPGTLTRGLAVAEVALGGALLTPVVPSRVAGLGLAAFSAGLLGLYMRIPGMRRQGSIRPSQDGMALAKDVWMLGMAVSLLLDPGSKRKKSKSKSKGD